MVDSLKAGQLREPLEDLVNARITDSEVARELLCDLITLTSVHDSDPISQKRPFIPQLVNPDITPATSEFTP